MIEHYRMPFSRLVRGFVNNALQSFAYLAFPSPIRVFLHKLKGVQIGKNVVIGPYVWIDTRNPECITIGDGAMITAACIIVAHQRDLSTYVPGKRIAECPLRSAPITIGRGVHIGMGTIVLPGVTIGDGAIIGAGSVVSRNVPPNSLAVGVPARVIKWFSDAK